MAIVTGTIGNDTLTGGIGADELYGLDGNDTLTGGPASDTAADTLRGGTGNDTYLIANPLDQIAEAAGEGVDEVRTDLAAYTLGNNLEHLTYTGSAAFTGIGNDLDNVIHGGTGNDTLAGGLGLDTLAGGAGNDLYLIDDTADLVVEIAGEGTDEVRTTLAAFTLATNVETLTYTGTGSFTGTGNSGNNSLTGGAGDDVLYGDAGNDTLAGGAGADTMLGGTGNDTYIVGSAGDVVIELAGEGTDEVRTNLSAYTLGDHVENLLFTGSGSFSGTGNALNNSLTGGSGADVLFGFDGDDTLNGGSGADSLTGGSGNDTYCRRQRRGRRDRTRR